MADADPGYTTPSEGAIYHEVSHKKILALRIFNGFVAFFVALSFLICLVRGQVQTNSAPDYILATNIIISSLVAGSVSWWYRTGDLGVEKYWFVVLVGCVMMFQCLTTDIYVFHKQVKLLPTPTPTPATTSRSKVMERNEEKDQVEDRVLEPRRSKRQGNVVSYTPKKKHKVVDKPFLESVESFVKKNRPRSLIKEEKLDILSVQAKFCHEHVVLHSNKRHGRMKKNADATNRTVNVLGRSNKLCSKIWTKFVETGVPGNRSEHPRGTEEQKVWEPWFKQSPVVEDDMSGLV